MVIHCYRVSKDVPQWLAKMRGIALPILIPRKSLRSCSSSRPIRASISALVGSAWSSARRSEYTHRVSGWEEGPELEW